MLDTSKLTDDELKALDLLFYLAWDLEDIGWPEAEEQAADAMDLAVEAERTKRGLT